MNQIDKHVLGMGCNSVYMAIIAGAHRSPISQLMKVTAMTTFGNQTWYPLVNYHSNGKWPFIVDFRIKNGDFPLLCYFTRG